MRKPEAWSICCCQHRGLGDSEREDELKTMKLHTLHSSAVILLTLTTMVGGQSCTSNEECSNSDFCSLAGTCVIYGCDEIYGIIDDQVDGIGPLKCQKYDGRQEGQIYACSVGTAINNGNVGLSIRPPITGEVGGSIARKFERECRADIPPVDPNDATDFGSIFWCLDNDGADYTEHKANIGSSGLTCDSGGTPIHASVRINLIEGLDIGSETVDGDFDPKVANSAYYASVLGKESADAGSDWPGTVVAGGESGTSSPIMMTMTATTMLSSVILTIAMMTLLL